MKKTLSERLRTIATGPASCNPENMDACNVLLEAADELDKLRNAIREAGSDLLRGNGGRAYQTLKQAEETP